MIEEKVNNEVNDIDKELREWRENQNIINFQERYRPYRFYQELRKLGLTKRRANDLKNIYKNGVYYLVQLELQYLKSQKK